MIQLLKIGIFHQLPKKGNGLVDRK